MEFVSFALIIVLGFLVIFLYSRLNDEIKNVKGKGVVEEIKKEIEGLIVEFNKVSNRKIIVIEEKIKEIENLIKLADEKILKLDALTRNYTELIKRYDIAKRDLQSTLTRFSNVKEANTDMMNSNLEKENINAEKRKPKSKLESNSKKEVQKTLVSETSKVEEGFTPTPSKIKDNVSILKDKLEVIREEVKKIDIESMDFDNRAELLRKLISYGFEDYELIKLGFTESEIRIAKVLISNET